MILGSVARGPVLHGAVGMGIACSLLWAAEARAQDEWKDEQGEKPPADDHPKKKDPEKDAINATPAKPTKVLLDLKIGPAFILASRFGGARGATSFSLQINAGYAIANDLGLKGDALYLTLSPYLIVGSDLALVAPLGVQYDLPLTMIPYQGLYAYARASFGYGFYQPPFNPFDSGLHAFAAQPALGARLTFFERFHVGIEPFGLDILHAFPNDKASPTSVTANTEQTIVAFQVSILGGARF